MGAPRLRDEDPVEELLDKDPDTRRRYEDDYDRPRRKSKSSSSMDAAEQDVGLMAKRWRNRRRMAWLSLIMMFAMTYMVFFTDYVDVERMKVLKEPLTWFYFACISVVGAYMGFTTWASRK